MLPLPVALFAALAIAAGAGATSPQKSAAAPAARNKKFVAKSPTKSTAKYAPKISTAAAAKRTTTSKTASQTTPKAKRPAVHRAPQQPSQERYKEIQQALSGKGYFTSEPDGNWGPSSIDALKRFQHDQNLVEDGKIGSLSLIALGLGPKREPAAESEQKTP